MYRIPAATIWADMIRTGLAGLLPLFGTAATTATTTTPALSVQLLGARSRSLPSVSSFSSSTFSFSFHLRGISRAFPNCAPASRFLSSSNPAAPSHHHHHHYLFSKARRRAHHGHDRDHDDHDHDHDHGHNLHLSSLLPFFRQNLSQMPADEGILSAIPDNAQKRPGKADLSKKKQKAAAAAAVAAVERQENNGCGEVVEVEEEEGGDEAAEAPRKDAWCLNKAKKLKLKEGQVQELLGQENSGCYEGGVVVAEVPRKDACPPPPQQQPPHPSAPGAEDSNINSVNNKAAVTGTKKRPHQDSQHHTPKKQKTKVPVVQETQSQSQSQPQSQPHPVLDTEEPPNSSAEVVIVEKGQETPAEDCNGTATTTTAPAPTPTAATQPYPSPGTEYPSSPPEIAEKIAAVKTFSLLVKKLSDKGRAPTRGSALAAGYDMYRCVIKPPYLSIYLSISILSYCYTVTLLHSKRWNWEESTWHNSPPPLP